MLTLIIPPDLHGCTVRQAALSGLRMSGGQFKRAKFEGSITLDGTPVHADVRVSAGQRLCITVPQAVAACLTPLRLPLRVPFEDDHLLVVDKPAPLPSAHSQHSSAPSLENAVYAHMGCPQDFVYRPVNRLDKGTSGLMIVARTAHAQQLLQKQLHTDDFVREYLAVVEGAPPQEAGVIELPIGKADGATIRREVRTDGKPACTHYRVVQTGGGRSLVRLRLLTGRTHQIRVHMAALGCPVAGDFLYGSELAALPGRFALHSAYLCLRHPVTGDPLACESPLPPQLAALLAQP